MKWQMIEIQKTIRKRIILNDLLIITYKDAISIRSISVQRKDMHFIKEFFFLLLFSAFEYFYTKKEKSAIFYLFVKLNLKVKFVIVFDL